MITGDIQVSSLFNTLSICTYDMRKPGCMVNISYYVVVNTSTVNKHSNCYMFTHIVVLISVGN